MKIMRAHFSCHKMQSNFCFLISELAAFQKWAIARQCVVANLVFTAIPSARIGRGCSFVFSKHVQFSLASFVKAGIP